jgi:hypothetical protein
VDRDEVLAAKAWIADLLRRHSLGERVIYDRDISALSSESQSRILLDALH